MPLRSMPVSRPRRCAFSIKVTTGAFPIPSGSEYEKAGMHMKANVDELAALLKLQNCDLQALQARKRLEQAPDREKLAALTQKREALEAKAAQVESMRERVESEVAAIEREDAQLVTKQARVQDLISLAEKIGRAHV